MNLLDPAILCIYHSIGGGTGRGEWGGGAGDMCPNKVLCMGQYPNKILYTVAGTSFRHYPVNEEAMWPSQLLKPTLACKQTQDKQM